MIQNFNLILGVDSTANDTKLSEDLKIFLFFENIMHWWIDHFWAEIFDQFIRHKIVDYELIIFQQLFDQTKVSFLLSVFFRWFRTDTFSDIIKNEHYPFRDMNFEHLVISYEFSDDLVNGVIKFKKFFLLIMLIFEYWFWLLWCLLQILLHIIK